MERLFYLEHAAAADFQTGQILVASTTCMVGKCEPKGLKEKERKKGRERERKTFDIKRERRVEFN